jgi:serpin B
VTRDLPSRAMVGATVLGVLLALAACGSTPPAVAELRSDVPRSAAADPGRAGAAVASFGTSLFAALPADGNLAFSPYSAYAALAMTRAGARGVTAAELDTLLRTTGTAEAGGFVTAVDRAWEAAVRAAAPTEHDKRSMTFDPANSLWAQLDLKIEAEFLDQLGAKFGAGLRPVDFAGDPGGSRKLINDWVSDRTHELIPELLPASGVTPATRLALVNAVYFAGSWRQPFSKFPDKAVFHTPSGDVDATIMSLGSDYRYATGDGWQAVSIPYHRERTAMTLIVPDISRFEEVASGIDDELLASATNGSTTYLQLTMPLFSVRTNSDLVSPLQALGVRTLFSEKDADLSGIAGPDSGLFVSDVVQEAVVTVDEQGTVAAAATAVMVAVTSARVGPVMLTVDRPFLFAIHDETTDAPLFLGRVVDPTK